jgi:UDP-N-acetylmuramate--alanine ligase
MEDFSKKHSNIHFVGIGGIGLSALARHFLSKKCVVSGSDNSSVDDLKKEGAKIFKGHKRENVPQNTDLLIYSNAISLDNPEIEEGRKLNAKIMSYPEAVGYISQNYYTIGVSGTHGKSTTTAMIALIMIRGGLDPTVIIGTKLKEFGGRNYRKGNSKYLLIEADEYKAALLNYKPKIAVITNIEEDHLDFYKNINDILSVFQKYINENIKNGTVIINEDDKYSKKLKISNKISYSLGQKETKKIKLSVPGRHNICNALAAFSASKKLGIKEKDILSALSAFKGTWRRFEENEVILKNKKKVILINDYAHHPTEIKATIQAVKEKYPKEKIVVVFQPHQYERTYRLFSQFISVLSDINVFKLLITDIYTVAGRESEEIKKKVSTMMLVDKTRDAVYTGSIKKTANYLLKNLQGNEILVIMGAGDVYGLSPLLKEEESKKRRNISTKGLNKTKK